MEALLFDSSLSRVATPSSPSICSMRVMAAAVLRLPLVRISGAASTWLYHSTVCHISRDDFSMMTLEYIHAKGGVVRSCSVAYLCERGPLTRVLSKLCI